MAGETYHIILPHHRILQVKSQLMLRIILGPGVRAMAKFLSIFLLHASSDTSLTWRPTSSSPLLLG